MPEELKAAWTSLWEPHAVRIFRYILEQWRVTRSFTLFGVYHNLFIFSAALQAALLRLPDQTQLDTHTHTRAAELLWSSDQPVAEAATYTARNKQETNIHALSGILTRDPSNQATAGLHALNRTATGTGFS
jgi:hypothetical protein